MDLHAKSWFGRLTLRECGMDASGLNQKSESQGKFMWGGCLQADLTAINSTSKEQLASLPEVRRRAFPEDHRRDAHFIPTRI